MPLSKFPKATQRRPAPLLSESLREIPGDWRHLCRKIGVRLAGTEGERQAAEFIRRRLHDAGIARVRIESFPCTSLRSARTDVQARYAGGWRRVESALMVGTPSTVGRGYVEGPLVWLEMPEANRRLRPGSLKGCILGLFGPMPTVPEIHRRLVAAAPLAVIHIDERFPLSWTKNDGVYPYWVRRYGMPPTLTVPYLKAWRWRLDGVSRVRVKAVAELRPARSTNVIGELPGLDPDLPHIVISSHHDTQRGNPGADDNASGVVALLALARVLAGGPWRRTIRFISFGTEEQLSVGSAAFVRRHRIRPADVGMVLNFDSVASPLGHFRVRVGGDDALAAFARERLAQEGLDVEAPHEIIPFVDCFPFNRAGVPSLSFGRSNFPGGRWQHHSRHDTIKNVSVAEMNRLLTAVVPMAVDLAEGRRWPFRTRLGRLQHARVIRTSRELFGW